MVNCENGIYVISTKMKEKIQNIKDIDFDYKKIIKVSKQKIYVINSLGEINFDELILKLI